MASPDTARFDYSWLDADRRPGAWLSEASCFTFVRGLTPQAVIEALGVTDAQPLDLTGDDEAADTLVEDHELDSAVLDGGDGWAVIYQDNAFPDQLVNELLAAPSVVQGVVVFWNVNSVIEFSLWERGEQVVSFEFPDERTGTQPDRLLAAMTELGIVDADPVSYGQLLALAEHVTGVHLDEDFLARPVLAFALAEDDVDY